MWGACQVALAGATILLFSTGPAQGQEVGSCTKPAVGDKIRKVENGVDDFTKYLESRGENAKGRAETAQSSGAKTQRGGRGDGANAKANKGANTEASKEKAGKTKDELSNALDELNRSTNRLRRKFDPSPSYMETKVQLEQVMDDGRKVNQTVARGKNDAQAGKLWKVLKAAINELARCYGVTPMGA